jgi:uncharacterized lipoprotein YmbA
MKRMVLALMTVGLLAAGCARTSPARFYKLTPVIPPVETGERTYVVALGPITIAPYLIRPQMVTRIGENELKYDHYNRWAEPLKDGIMSAMADNLRAALPAAAVIEYPGSEAFPYRYRVLLQVIRFEAEPGKDAVLRAGWLTVPAAGEDRSGGHMFDQRAKLDGDDYAAIARAESELLAALAREVAAEIEAYEVKASGQASPASGE